jgi:hypothetical protein
MDSAMKASKLKVQEGGSLARKVKALFRKLTSAPARVSAGGCCPCCGFPDPLRVPKALCRHYRAGFCPNTDCGTYLQLEEAA